MKLILLTLFFSLSLLFNVQAEDCPSFMVHKRIDPNGKIGIYKTCISELKNKKKFETEDFKIVIGTSNSPVTFQNVEYRQKAATTFYHLQKAKKYFIQKFGEKSVSHIGQLTIRLDMDRTFLDISHFAGAHLPAEYNNALTIPPSDDKRLESYAPWNYEIWFRPSIEEEVDIPLNLIATPLSSQHLREESLVMGAGNSFIDMISGHDIDYIFSNSVDEFAVILGFYYLLPGVLNTLQGKVHGKLSLETSLIPEIIYHEYVHTALGNFLFPRQATPLIEGLANYYATKIANNFKIGDKVGHRDKGVEPKDGSQINQYHPRYETRELAQHTYAFQLLYHIGELIPEQKGEAIIYKALELLDSSSDLKYDLMNAITRSIKKSDLSSSSKLQTLLRLNELAIKFGL